MSFFLSFSFFFGPSEKALLMSVTVLTGGQLLSLSQECCQAAPEMGEQEKGKFTTWVNKCPRCQEEHIFSPYTAGELKPSLGGAMRGKAPRAGNWGGSRLQFQSAPGYLWEQRAFLGSQFPHPYNVRQNSESEPKQ